MQSESELTWHDDGHSINLRIEKTDLVVVGFNCPNHIAGSACRGNFDYCVVEWFVNRFGLECNVGICTPSAEIKIAWAITGDQEAGLDLCQVWIIPTTDEFFSAWAATQST